MNTPKNLEDDDLHDKILIACLEYNKYIERWETKNTVYSYYAAQRSLRKLRDLSDEKLKAMRIEFHGNDPRSPLYRERNKNDNE